VRVGVVAVVGTFLVSSSLARAEDHAVPAEPMEVTVRESRDADTFTSTRAASTITERDLRDANPGSLADGLRGRAGVSVQQTTPGQGTIYLRGLAGREIVTTIDGVRFNTAIFRAPNNAAFTLVDPFSIHEAEVLRGPSSVLHASDALGGVIALTTRLPSYSPIPASSVDTFQSVTSNPIGGASRISVARSVESWASHVGVTYQVAGDVRPGGGIESPHPWSYAGLERPSGGTYAPRLETEQVGTGFQRLAADAVVRHALGRHVEIVVRSQISRRPELVRYDEITPRFRGDFPARAESFLGPLERTMTSVTLVHRPATAFYRSALVVASWQRLSEHLHRRNMNETCLGGETPCTSTLRLVPARSVQMEDTRSDSFGLRAELQLLDQHRGAHGATVGAEALTDHITSRINAGDTRYPSGSSMTQGGVFAQLETRVGPSVRLLAGARLAAFLLDIPGRAGTAPVDNELFDVGLTSGVRWEAVPGLSWVANVGRGVRSPNIEDFAAVGTRAGGRFQVANTDLRPEHTHSVDAGIKVKRGWVRAETYAFFLRYSDAIGLASTTLNGEARAADGTRYVRSENVRRLDFYGVEGDVRVGPEDGAGVFVRYIAMSFTEEARPGVSAAERVLAPAQMTAGVYWHVTPSLRLESFAYVRDTQRRLANPDDNRIPRAGTPGFVSVHTRLAWLATRVLTGRLSGDNLTNARVLEHGSGFYAPGFSVTASLEARL
jgi:hemoglobin/transferrin/lactoferrin receptor protein